MTAIISFTLTFLNVQPFRVSAWYKSWLIAFILVYTTSFFLPKIVKKFISKIIKVEEMQ
ncbi:DUF2798 domain-containing protein [Niallia nealsonii]